MNDGELARRCARGEASAWEELLRSSLDVVWRAVARVLETEADVEDVVQSLFVKLLEEDGRRLRSFQGRSRITTWLVAVARRDALEYAEKRRRPSPSGSPPPALDPALLLETAQDAQKVQDAVERLPARDRLLVRLIYMDGASYDDAARLLAVPVNSISPWLGRAKERLREILQDGVRIQPPAPSKG